jgi:hypothetical protein
VNRCDKAIVISTDVEDGPAIHRVRGWIRLTDIFKIAPFRSFRHGIPSVKRIFRVSMGRPELLEQFLADHVHERHSLHRSLQSVNYSVKQIGCDHFIVSAAVRYNHPQTKDLAVMGSGRVIRFGDREPRGWDAVPNSI